MVKADAYGHGAVESGTIEQVRVVLATASRGAAVPALCVLLSWWSAYFLLVEVSLPPQWCTSVTAVVCVVSPVFLLEPRKEDKCGPGDAAALLSTSALCVSSAASWCSYNRLGQAFGGMPSIAALPAVLALGAAHCFVLACQLRRLTSSPQESPVSAHRESIDSLQAELIRNGFHTPPAADLSLAPCVCQAERVATVAKKGTGILGLLVACREGSRSSGGGAGSLWAGAAMAVIVTDTLVRAYQPRWLAAGSGEDPPVERWLYRYVYSPLPALDTMRPGSSQKPDIQAEATTPGGESGGNRAGTGALASWLEEEAARRGESLRHGDLSSPAPPGQPATVGLQPTTVGLLGLAKSLTARLRSNHMVHT